MQMCGRSALGKDGSAALGLEAQATPPPERPQRPPPHAVLRPFCATPLDLAQWFLSVVIQSLRHMKPRPKEPRLGKDEPSSKPTRRGEARRIIEEYANDLRE